jgi:DNA invertase Pin-like site-specific DNA recombinase
MTTQNFKVYVYLRASTEEQDATRARETLEKFATEKNIEISKFFIENESGTIYDRPELHKLINEAMPGDILFAEGIDRVTRLEVPEMMKLFGLFDMRGIRLLMFDFPPTYSVLNTDSSSDFVTSMMIKSGLYFFGYFARKNLEDIKRRTAQGRENAKKRGVVFGRKRGELGKRMQEAEPKILSILTKHPKLSAGLVGKMEKANRDTVRKIAKKNGFEYYGKELGWVQKTEIQTKTKIIN